MKDKQNNILEKVGIFIASLIYKYFKKIEEKYLEATHRKCYLESIKLFPKMKLSKSNELASNIACKLIFNLEYEKENVNLKKLQKLEEVILNDEWIKKTLSDLNRLKAYFRFNNKEKQKEHLEKAMEYVSDVKEIEDFKEVRKIYNKIKTDTKIFLKESRKLNNIIFEKEKLKIIKPIEISSSIVILLLTLFSTFFLISGILHNKILFYSLGLNITDFYSISDYIATSIEVIMYTLFFSLIGTLSYFLGYIDSLKQSIFEKQFNIEGKTLISKFKEIAIFSLVILFVDYLLFGKFSYLSLFPLSFALFIFILNQLPFWKYIKNKSLVMNFLIVSVIYLTVLLYNVFSIVDNIRSDDYKNPYNLVFNDASIDYSKYKYITSNSNFVFLLDKDTNIFKIIPIYEIKEFEQTVE